MRAFTVTSTGLLAFAASAQASNYLIKNYCPTDVYLTIANQTATNLVETLNSGLAYLSTIEGQGNSVGITKQPGDYWASNGPKIIFGTSTSQGTLWWSLSEQVGDPFVGQEVNVTSSDVKLSDVCGHAEGYAAGIKNCVDEGVTLTVNLCSVNQ